MAQATRLQTLSVEEVEAPPPPRAESALTGLLALSLRALSQRALVALSSLVDLALIASCFVLWLRAMDSPSTLQLMGLGGYSIFILVALWVRRKGS